MLLPDDWNCGSEWNLELDAELGEVLINTQGHSADCCAWMQIE
jgi:hypothetical protein